MTKPRIAAFLALALLAAPVLAEEAEKPLEIAVPADATSHLVYRDAAFTVTAGSLALRDAKGEEQAKIFYTAYVKDGAAKAERPLSFVFNGGPGAASAYLHLGALGPKVLDFGADGRRMPAEAEMVDNASSWLGFTDLVFVDPVGTGFSRARDEEHAKKFWGVTQDLESLGRFLQLYLARSDRLVSPKYLVGESYGGFRAAALPHQLQTSEGIALAGVVMVSPVIEFGLMRRDELDPLSDALRLPAYAAVELERQGRLGPEALDEVERFAMRDYLLGLIEGPRAGEGAQRLFAEVARRIGLPEEVVARRNGRISIEVFQKEFRRTEQRLVSRYDGSASGPDPYPASPRARGGDPVLEGTRAAFTSAMLRYYRETLGLSTELPYRLLNGDVGGKWDWRSGLGGSSQGYVGASDELREALALNPRLRVLIVHGLTDLQTPYMMSRYVVEHLPKMGEKERVALRLYPGGHMMYLRGASRARLHEDAAAFYAAAE